MSVKSPNGVLAVRPVVRPRASWEHAAERFRAFLAQVPVQRHHVILCHSDADGLAAGLIARQMMERTDRRHLTLLPTGKGQSAWNEEMLERIGAVRPDVLFVLDLGSRPQPLFPGVPTLLIDHHRPLGVPPAGNLISSYQWSPNPCTAALVYWLAIEVAPVEDLDWIAAVGIVGDLGEHATIEPLPSVRRRYGSHILKETAALVNSARRGETGDVLPALRALATAREPADIARGRLPEARWLQDLRAAFNAALAQAKKAAPTFAGPLALIRVHSPYQIHPVLAQIWRGRLPDKIVMVVNDGYLAGYVSFSLRTALDVNLFDFLEPFRASLNATELGYGHDKATGGNIPAEDMKRFLATLGFR